jgi:hypothetical protein
MSGLWPWGRERKRLILAAQYIIHESAWSPPKDHRHEWSEADPSGFRLCGCGASRIPIRINGGH